MVEFTAGASLEGATGKVLGVPVFAERNWGPGADVAAGAVGDRLEAQLDLVDFTGKLGQVAVVPSEGPFESYAFIGLGEEADSETVRQAAGWFARAVSRIDSVATTLHQVDVDGAAQAVAEGFELALYRFDKYRSEGKPSSVESVTFVGETLLPPGPTPTPPDREFAGRCSPAT